MEVSMVALFIDTFNFIVAAYVAFVSVRLGFIPRQRIHIQRNFWSSDATAPLTCIAAFDTE